MWRLVRETGDEFFPPTDVKCYFSHPSGRTQWMAVLSRMNYDSWIEIVSLCVFFSNDFGVNSTFSTALALYSQREHF